MTLFKERQEAVKTLYQAAGRLLDNAAEFESSISRELNRQVANNCINLAEKIAGMGPIKITCDTPTSLEVEGIPFDVGFQVETVPPPEVEDERKK